MKYDFDRIIPRRNTDCFKYDGAAIMGKPKGLIPMWVADMDFQTPPEVTAEIMATAERAVYGYGLVSDDYAAAVFDWFAENFDFRPERDWLTTSPGVVFAVAMAIRSQTGPGQAVMIQEPAYHPFARLVKNNGRQLVVNELVYKDGRYSFDPDEFEELVAGQRVKLFILCNPHNPVGRVWTEAELRTMGDICLKHGCLVVSDEIHCDFVRPGRRHLVFATLSPEFAANSITCTAPSKTFNLAGLQASNIFIPAREVRDRFVREKNNTGYLELNTMALTACRAAYTHGREWLDQLKVYLESNLAMLKSAVGGLTGVKVVEPEGTYLAWLDFNGLGLSAEKLDELIVGRAGLWLDEGWKFGRGGEGFYRMNLACPKSTLAEALKRLEAATASLG